MTLENTKAQKTETQPTLSDMTVDEFNNALSALQDSIKTHNTDVIKAMSNKIDELQTEIYQLQTRIQTSIGIYLTEHSIRFPPSVHTHI